MKPGKTIILVILFCLTAACSSETVKRTTYETLENVRMNQCDKELSADCQNRQSYEEYQRKRSEL